MDNQTAEGADTPNLVRLTAAVTSAYVANNSVQSVDLSKVIEAIHSSLVAIGQPKVAPEPARRELPISVRKSVTPDAIISMEDGKAYKSLKRHLSGRGMTPQEYREKWGLPHDYPMVASSYAAKRSELARSIGLGRKKEIAAEPALAPKRTRRTPSEAEAT